ncbi:hypothetical protein OPT61_g4126 [Boeremia exigua]|uniref:Uncharacterized protein n=1 Tax=Boeremia exigua TaxID=749465 RepID=A0ACC2IF52_9PLEO|nr:hypothetical protein OPT61_g4126 [Boeremia exigua]
MANMLNTWSLSVYSQLVWLGTFINDFILQMILQMQAKADHVINSNYMLSKWLSSSPCGLVSEVTAFIAVGIIGVVLLCFSSWKIKRASAALKASQDLQPTAHAHASRADSQPNDATATPPPATPIPRKQANSSASTVSSSGSSTSSSSSPSNPSQRNFSHLAQDAPVSYATLQRDGVLDAVGTPTKKYSPARKSGSPGFSPTRIWGHDGSTGSSPYGGPVN